MGNSEDKSAQIKNENIDNKKKKKKILEKKNH